MKKLILLSTLFLLVFSAIALADLSVSNANLGGDEQERTFDDDEPVYAEATFTITNNGVNVTGISISDNANSEYNVTFSGYTNGFNLTNGSSKQITVKAIVPEDFDAVDSDGKEKAFDIGDIIVIGDGVPDAKADLFMQAENKLDIDDVSLEWDDESEDVKDGENIDNIRPGDTIAMKIIVENEYKTSGDYDFDIENVEIELESSDDDEVDFDDNSDDLGDLGPKDDTEANFNIEVEDDADGTYEIEIFVTGEDENGALHGAYFTFDLEVEKQKEDITIKSASLSPETISCDRTARLEVRIENIGSRDSDDVVLLIESEELGIKERIVNLDLEEDDDYDKTFIFNIGDDVDAGIYIFDVTTYFDSDDYDDEDYNDIENVLLTVKDCETSTPPAEEDEEEVDDVIVVQPGTGTPTGGVVYGEPVTKTDDFFESNTYIALLAVGALIGIALLFLAIAILVRR